MPSLSRPIERLQLHLSLALMIGRCFPRFWIHLLRDDEGGDPVRFVSMDFRNSAKLRVGKRLA